MKWTFVLIKNKEGFKPYSHVRKFHNHKRIIDFFFLIYGVELIEIHDILCLNIWKDSLPFPFMIQSNDGHPSWMTIETVHSRSL